MHHFILLKPPSETIRLESMPKLEGKKNLQESSLSLRLSQKHQWSSDDEGLPAGKDLKHFGRAFPVGVGGPR